MKRFILIIIISTGLCNARIAFSQTDLSFTEISRKFNFWDRIDQIEVIGEYAYVATGTTGLHILNIAALDSVYEVGNIDSINCNGFIIIDSLLYTREISIINIADPTNPHIINKINFARGVKDLYINNDLAVIGLSWHNFFGSGVQIYDISHPDSPQQLSDYYFPLASTAFSANDSMIFFAEEYYNRFIIFNYADPSNLEIVFQQEMDSEIIEMKLVDNLLFYVEEDFGVRIFDISNPSSPEIYTEFETDLEIDNFLVNDEFIYLFTYEGILVLQFNEQQEITEREFIQHSELRSNGVFVNGNNFFVGGRTSKLSIYDIEQQQSPILINTTDFDGGIGILDVYNDIVYGKGEISADSLEGVFLFEKTNEDSLSILSVIQFEHTKDAYSVPVFYDNYAYISFYDWQNDDEQTLMIYNIGDPTDPQLVNEIQFGERLFKNPIILDGSLYGSIYHGFIKFDLANPIDLEDIGTFEFFDGSVLQHYFYEDYVIIRDNDKIQIWDIQDLNGLRLLSTIERSNILNFAFSRDVLSVVNEVQYQSGSYLSIFDISNPEEPIFRGDYWAAFPEPFSHYKMEAVDNYIYCLSPTGLSLFDISDLRHPEYYGFIHQVTSFCIDNENIIASAGSGVRIYDMSLTLDIQSLGSTNPNKFTLSSYPNPFNSSTTIAYSVGANSTSPVTLSLYDLQGRLVQTLVEGRLTPGNYRTTLNANGLASGVYVVRMFNSIEIQTGKLILTK